MSDPIRYAVSGMNCGSCIAKVEGALQALPQVSTVNANLANGSVTVSGSGELDAVVTQTLDGLGYAAKPWTNPVEAAASSDTAANAIWRRFVIAAVLTIPVFVLEMGGHIFPAFHHLIGRTIGMQSSWMIQFALATLVLAWPGAEFYRKGIPSLLRGAPDMNALVVLGTAAAWGYSTVALFWPGLLPAADRAVYFEAAAVIVTLILLGRWLEARAKGQTGDAIRRLIGLRPETATVVRDGQDVTVALDDIQTGDLIRIRPGERIAVDGVITQGTSWIDETMITGEPIAVEKGPDAPLIGGTINGNGAMVMQAQAVGADTMLARIIEMVENAQASRLPVQDMVNKITGLFVPAVLVIAALTVVAWLVFGGDAGLSKALVAGVSVLIIACPCAMGLAVPVSIMVGTGRAAEMGVLFRQGAALQALGGVKTIAFDKTGTLTKGQPELTDVVDLTDDKERFLATVAAVEAQSEHPLAAPIVAAAMGASLPSVSSFEAVTGQGLRAQVAGQEVLIGNDKLLAQKGIDAFAIAPRFEALTTQAKTVILVAIGGKLAGLMALSDTVYDSAQNTIATLSADGVTTVLITGDTLQTAQAIAEQLGIDNVHAQTLPADKAAIVERLSADATTAFVGDGINDAPALAIADVGIAMGGGTDVAMQSADVVLMRSDPAAVLNARTISLATMRNIRQNLGWAFGYNILLIPVAAMGLLSPGLAAGAMALSSVLVVSNALRLRSVGT